MSATEAIYKLAKQVEALENLAANRDNNENIVGLGRSDTLKVDAFLSQFEITAMKLRVQIMNMKGLVAKNSEE
jgi:hypothetical protein